MIRRLYLVNKKGIPFYFDYRTSTLISNLSGLGFENEFTYLKFDNYYDRVDKVMPMTEIGATLTFLKGYQGYTTFLNYLKDTDEDMLLYYESDNLKYAYIEVKSISKTELVSGVLQCDIKFDKKSLWLKDNVFTIDVNTDNRGKVYPYTYPYSFSISFEGKINITNSGNIKAPLKIEMSGAVNNPEVNIKKDDDVVSSLRLYVSSQDSQITVSSDVRDQFMIMTDSGITHDVYQDQDFTCDNFLFVEPGDYVIEFKPGVSSQTNCRIMMTEAYVGN